MRSFTLSTATYVIKSFLASPWVDERPFPIGHSDKEAWITSFSKLCEIYEINQYSAWLLHSGFWYFSIILMGQIKNITAFSARQLFVD